MNDHVLETSRGTCSTSRRGFTLVELVISVSLGAVLLVALATSSGLFGSQLQTVSALVDRGLEESLATMQADVEQAWVVDRVSDTRIEIHDALGNMTAYFLDGNDLNMTRPTGETGVILAGVDDLSFSVGTQTRYRDDEPLERDATVWERAIEDAEELELPILGGPGHTEENLPYYSSDSVPGLLRSGDSLALGFLLDPEAPLDAIVVDGITESVEISALRQLTIPVSFLEQLPTPPFNVVDVDLSGPTKKVKFCHKLDKRGGGHTITTSEAAWAAHEAHGDVLTDCPPVTGTLTLEIYEARSVDDARPFGPVLTTMTFDADVLPIAEPSFYGVEEFVGVYWYSVDGAGLVFTAPDEAVAVELGTDGVDLQPGVPYTVTLGYEGDGVLVFRTAGSDSVVTGVATQPEGDTSFSTEGTVVAAAVTGLTSITQTEQHDVVNRVTTRIEMLDGRALVGSSLVASQVAVSEPWFGAVPGEFPVLELQGE